MKDGKQEGNPNASKIREGIAVGVNGLTAESGRHNGPPIASGFSFSAEGTLPPEASRKCQCSPLKRP